MIKDVAVLASGFLMGWAFDNVWPYLHPALRKLQRRERQWFKPSDGPARPAPSQPGPQPRPAPVRGQRPAQGAHRPEQRRVRFGGRSYRSRRL